MYNVKTGKLTLNKKVTGSTLYDYEIVPGSTYAIDEEKQQASLKEMFALLAKDLQVGQDGKVNSPLLMKMKEEGKDIKISEILLRIISGSGIVDWSKIINDGGESQDNRTVTPEDEQSLQADQEQFIQMLQGIQGQGGQINQIPPQDPMGGQPQMQPEIQPIQQAPQVPQMGGLPING